MKRNVIVISAVVFVLALLGFAGWANHLNRVHAALQVQAQQDQANLVSDAAGVGHLASPMVGKAAPSFTLTNLQGKKVSLADYKGKAIQLNFWATWCAPCKIETPWLVDLEKQYSPQGFEILGVSFDDLDQDDTKLLAKEKVDIAKAADQLGIHYPVLLDGDSIAKSYGDPDVFPTSFFINREGEITNVTFGLTSKDDLENNIRKALGEAK
ncbi:TlpA family protein disulfide reductase [Acidicapsa dinghuensis]|uniref:TlpA family protein disulfide reductase n=1 Tax=Acidicapsa dinghuensis TaxID=2218256 RepID=A0ABW1EIR1_9BACT|nr:TlpA disulfide reductase family protein [Acidicapsa dinghuensis]